MATMRYCEAENDPSKVFASGAPAPRQDVWTHHEVLRLVQGAWRADKREAEGINVSNNQEAWQ